MKGRKKALGRGLEALLPHLDAGENDTEQATIEIDLIDPNPYQPRVEWNPEDLETLASSILAQGILQPLILRRTGERFQLIAGERRLRAAKLAGLKRVPAVLREANDGQMIALALVENIHRKDLGPMEKGEAFRRLHAEFDLTQDEMGRQVGLSRSAVANFIRLLDLPESVQALLRNGRLSMGHGRALLGLDNNAQMERLARKTIRRDLSVRQLEELVRHPGSLRKGKKPGKKTAQPPETDRLVTRLQRRFKTRVRLRDKNGTGRIEIDYHSLEELDRILEMLLQD
jgi:ParB family chromosome partitioning protein